MAAEDVATEAQIKHLYGVIHGLGMDPKEWKKNSNIGSFAKLTRKQCSDYITELEAMEAAQKAGNSQPVPAATTIPTTDNRAEAEAQRIREEQGLTTEAAPAAKPEVEDVIAKYVEMLAQVTEAVNAEDRIPDREKGYAVKFIFYSVRGAMENGGDNREE